MLMLLPNKSLDRSAGSVFRNLLDSAEGALTRAAASTLPFGGKTWRSISPQCMVSSSRKSPPSGRCANRWIVSLRGAPKVARTRIGKGVVDPKNWTVFDQQHTVQKGE